MLSLKLNANYSVKRCPFHLLNSTLKLFSPVMFLWSRSDLVLIRTHGRKSFWGIQKPYRIGHILLIIDGVLNLIDGRTAHSHTQLPICGSREGTEGNPGRVKKSLDVACGL